MLKSLLSQVIHPVREASTSAAAEANATMNEIMQAADYSTESVLTAGDNRKQGTDILNFTFFK